MGDTSLFPCLEVCSEENVNWLRFEWHVGQLSCLGLMGVVVQSSCRAPGWRRLSYGPDPQGHVLSYLITFALLNTLCFLLCWSLPMDLRRSRNYS